MGQRIHHLLQSESPPVPWPLIPAPSISTATVPSRISALAAEFEVQSHTLNARLDIANAAHLSILRNASLALSVAVDEDLDLLESDESTSHHRVEQGKEAVDPLLGVDDLNHKREIFG